MIHIPIIGSVIFLLLINSTNTDAKIDSSYFTYKQFEDNNLTLDNDLFRDKSAVVVMGNIIDLRKTNISLSNAENRTTDLVIIAQEINIGPTTEIDASGMMVNETSDELLRGGDIYLVTPVLRLTGQLLSFCGNGNSNINNGKDDSCQRILKRPWKINREGFENTNSKSFKGRRGRVHIFADTVVLDNSYVDQQSSFLVQSRSEELKPIPPVMLKNFARGFSSSNPIHQVIKSGNLLLWAELPKAFSVWLAMENAQSLLRRELKLDVEMDFGQQSDSDTFASFKDANSRLPTNLLSDWYISMVNIAAGLAQAAMARSEFEAANEIIHKILPLTKSAPRQALGSKEMFDAIENIRNIQKELDNKYIIEELTFPIEGGQPAKVTIIRNMSLKSVKVFPNQIIIQASEMNLGRRVGFLRKTDQNIVNMSLYGVLQVDPSLLDLVKKKYEPDQYVVLPVGEDVEFSSLDIGFLDVIAQFSSISRNGQVVINLQLLADSAIKQIVLLGQLFGVDATVMYHNRKDTDLNSKQIQVVNLNLRRTSSGIKITDGSLKNPFQEAITINYLIDNNSIVNDGFPAYVESNAPIQYKCKSQWCFVPGAAILHDINWKDPLALFEPLTDESIIRSFEITNHLDLEDSPRGEISALEVAFEFKSSNTASVQTVGPVILTKRGTEGSRTLISFLGNPAGSGELTVKGRVFWGGDQSFQDIRKEITNPPSVFFIDRSFFFVER